MRTGSLTVVDADAPKTKVVKKTAAKKAVRKTAAKKVTKKPVATKAPKKTAAKKKTLAKKATVKKTAKKPAATKTTKKTTVKKTVTKATKKATKKTSTTSSTAKPVTKEELIHVRREPLGHLLVEKLLREVGFRGGVSSDKAILDKYSTDESIFSIRPQIVLQPKDQRDVEIAVGVLGRETVRFPSLSLTPRAAGTGLSGGSLTDSVIIDVCAYMHHIGDVENHKGTKTITVQPGAMWKTVEKKLKKEKLYLPSYPASKDICSIGGSIANNAAGPDSLRFGHCADWVESLDITLYDGKTYTLRPITYKEYKGLIKQKNALATILSEVFAILEKHEKTIDAAKPKTKKNSAGYALWDVLNVSVASFKRGHGTLDLTRLVSGSQGTVGIITSITLRTEPINPDTALIAVPLFDLKDVGNVIVKSLDYDPINVEIFDGLTFDLALSNPDFFRDRIHGIDYYKVLLAMYTLYHVRYRRKTPEFTLLITLDTKKLSPASVATAVAELKNASGKRARLIARPVEKEMFWQIRRASYTLSKFQDKQKRPAAFLEDMTVPPKNLPKFFTDIKRLLKQYNITAAVHGHGGNGHLHFYPLLDFTSKATPALVEKMAEEFFATAVKYDGNICGEHNDGIIRTPHLGKMFNQTTLKLFEKVENIFDPDDIFNPGKKVHPRFDIKTSIRKKN